MHPYSILCWLFRDRSEATRDLLKHGHSLRISPSEETLTDVNLIEIQRKAKPYVFSKKFSKREEGAVTGADWLWLFGDRSGWIYLLVHAKKITPGSGIVAELHYKRGTGSQRTLLHGFAAQHSLLPVYAFYSDLSQPELGLTIGGSSADFGCFIASDATVLAMHSRRHARSVRLLLPNAIPWHFLVCPGGDAQLAHHVLSCVRELERVKGELSDEEFEYEPVRASITENVPEIALRHLRDGGVSVPDFSAISIVSSEPLASIPVLEDVIARERGGNED